MLFWYCCFFRCFFCVWWGIMLVVDVDSRGCEVMFFLLWFGWLSYFNWWLVVFDWDDCGRWCFLLSWWDDMCIWDVEVELLVVGVFFSRWLVFWDWLWLVCDEIWFLKFLESLWGEICVLDYVFGFRVVLGKNCGFCWEWVWLGLN